MPYPRTVRVLLHVGSDNRVAVGLVKSTHMGTSQVSRRLAGARPVDGCPSVPRGVDPDLWLAYQALHQRITDLIDQAEGISSR